MGRRPGLESRCDDLLFCSQCSAEVQTENTLTMLERWEDVWADGVIDDRDEAHLRYLYRHTRLEHRENKEQQPRLSETRKIANGLFAQLAGMRRQIRQTVTV